MLLTMEVFAVLVNKVNSNFDAFTMYVGCPQSKISA